MNCEDALRLLAEYLDGELHDGSEADVHKHIEQCRSCFSRAEFEKRLKAQLAGLAEHPANPILEQRIRNLMNSFRTE